MFFPPHGARRIRVVPQAKPGAVFVQEIIDKIRCFNKIATELRFFYVKKDEFFVLLRQLESGAGSLDSLNTTSRSDPSHVRKG